MRSEDDSRDIVDPGVILITRDGGGGGRCGRVELWCYSGDDVTERGSRLLIKDKIFTLSRSSVVTINTN